MRDPHLHCLRLDQTKTKQEQSCMLILLVYICIYIYIYSCIFLYASFKCSCNFRPWPRLVALWSLTGVLGDASTGCVLVIAYDMNHTYLAMEPISLRFDMLPSKTDTKLNYIVISLHGLHIHASTAMSAI